MYVVFVHVQVVQIIIMYCHTYCYAYCRRYDHCLGYVVIPSMTMKCFLVFGHSCTIMELESSQEDNCRHSVMYVLSQTNAHNCILIPWALLILVWWTRPYNDKWGSSSQTKRIFLLLILYNRYINCN